MTDDQQIAAVREEIRHSGRTARRWRLSVGGVMLLPAVTALVGTIVVFWGNPRRHVISRFTPVNGKRYVAVASPDISVMMIGFWLLLAFSVALLVAALYRTIRRFRIQQHLATLRPHQIADVLLSLRGERGDTRKILTPLFRQFGIATELAPAAAPDARGDEATPAEPSDGSRLDI